MSTPTHASLFADHYLASLWSPGFHRADVAPLLEVIDRNVQLEARLIDDLLDLTRIEHGKLQLQQEAADVHQLVGAAISICRDDVEGKGLALDVALGAERSLVQGDPARLQQVLWNLLRIPRRRRCRYPRSSEQLVTTHQREGNNR